MPCQRPPQESRARQVVKLLDLEDYGRTLKALAATVPPLLPEPGAADVKVATRALSGAAMEALQVHGT